MFCRFESPAGVLFIEETDGAVTKLTASPLPGIEGDSPVLCQTREELGEYFSGTRKSFTVPIAPKGTAFQQTVWTALRAIPYGETRSYGEIAAQIGKPRAARPSAARTTKTRF